MNRENEWFAGELEAEGQRIVTRGRLFIDPKMLLYPYRIEVQWLYKGAEGGMPTTQESEQIDKALNSLTLALEEQQVALLTAIHIGAKQAIYMYYVQNIDRFSQTLDQVFGSLPPLPINIGAEKDANWDEYKAMLQKFGM